MSAQARIVHLNVGGTRYSTSSTTLKREPESMLARMLEQENEMNLINQGRELFIDRDGKIFDFILNYLRGVPIELFLPNEQIFLDKLTIEADFFQLNELKKLIKIKLDDPQVLYPKFAIGSSVKFNASSIESKELQDYLILLLDTNVSEVTFRAPEPFTLKQIACWYCDEPAAQKLHGVEVAARSDKKKTKDAPPTFLKGMIGQISSLSRSCTVVKIWDNKYKSVVGLKRNIRGDYHYERATLGYFHVHVPLAFLETV